MNIAYIRVSTADQNFDRQYNNLSQYGIDKTFCEKISAKTKDRPELKNLIEFAREGDTIYIDDFSRLARNTKDLLEIVEQLEKKQVQVISHKEKFDTSTPTGKLMLSVIASIHQFERELLLERQQEGIKSAKENGKYIGGKIKQIENFGKFYEEWKTRVKSKSQLAKELKISRPTLNKLFKQHQEKLPD